MMITSITLPPQSPHLFRHRHYGGATLLFVLVILLVVSIIGVAAARSTLMQERMAANADVRNVVFEAAESALAAGEIRIANTPQIWKTIPDNKKGECWKGVCDRNTSSLPRWISSPTIWQDPKEHSTTALVKNREQGGIEVKEPKYIIEDLGQTMASCDANHIDITRSVDCPYTSAQRYFRVVSFAKAYETQVMLQSTYLDPTPTREEVTPAAPWKAKDPECAGQKYSPAGKRCCPADAKHSTEWLHDGSECPSYCEKEPGKLATEYDPNNEQCCNPGPGDKRALISKQEKCPEYCNGEIWDTSKQVCCNVKGKVSLYPGTNTSTDCPQFCGDDPKGPGQVCCKKGGKDYSYTANSISDCPVYCDVGGTPTLVGPGQSCCPNASGTDNEVINGGKCPVYCDGKIWGSNQSCCTVPGGQRLVNGGRENCPKFCGVTEYVPGPTQQCCGDYPATQKIFDPTTQKCCKGGNNAIAIIKTNEFCCTDQHGNRVANPTQNCPIYCGYGQNAIRIYDGEQCCNSYGTPVKATNTQQCCGSQAVPRTASGICPETCNGQSYDPGIQKCCNDYDANGRERQNSLVGNRDQCPQFCNAPGSNGHNQLLAPGETCCTDKNDDNYGKKGRCLSGSGTGAGA